MGGWLTQLYTEHSDLYHNSSGSVQWLSTSDYLDTQTVYQLFTMPKNVSLLFAWSTTQQEKHFSLANAHLCPTLHLKHSYC